MDVYQENGYKDRAEYLFVLAGELGIPMYVVVQLAELLGPNEDFDGLVTMLEDYTDQREC